MKKLWEIICSGGYLYFMLYSPSCERKSGMPLSVETPAPPKNTIFSLSSIIDCKSMMLPPECFDYKAGCFPRRFGVYLMSGASDDR